MSEGSYEKGKNHRCTFGIRRNQDNERVQILIAEPPGIKAEGLGLTTWGSSKVLAQQLWQLGARLDLPPDHSNGDAGLPLRLTVLELGAGTGLVGIAAAFLWQCGVVLTDLEPIVPGTEASCRLNLHLLHEGRASLACGTLDWTKPSKLHISKTFLRSGEVGKKQVTVNADQHKFTTILSADTLYDEEQPPLLVNTIVAWLARTSEARVVVCYACRFAYMDVIRDFWQRMEDAGLQCVAEQQENLENEESGRDWMEVGGTPYEWCVWRWKSECNGDEP